MVRKCENCKFHDWTIAKEDESFLILYTCKWCEETNLNAVCDKYEEEGGAK